MKAPKVLYKIAPGTPDEDCSKCAQCWNGECCAFCFPHSAAERAQRMTGQPLCDKSFATKVDVVKEKEG